MAHDDGLLEGLRTALARSLPPKPPKSRHAPRFPVFA